MVNSKIYFLLLLLPVLVVVLRLEVPLLVLVVLVRLVELFVAVALLVRLVVEVLLVVALERDEEVEVEPLVVAPERDEEEVVVPLLRELDEPLLVDVELPREVVPDVVEVEPLRELVLPLFV